MPSWSDREIKSLSVNVITYSLILRIIHVWRVARRSWNSEITAWSYAIQPIHCNSEVIKWSNGNSSAINSTWLCHSVGMNACLGPSVFDTVIWPCSSLSCHRKPRSLSPVQRGSHEMRWVRANQWGWRGGGGAAADFCRVYSRGPVGLSNNSRFS